MHVRQHLVLTPLQLADATWIFRAVAKKPALQVIEEQYNLRPSVSVLARAGTAAARAKKIAEHRFKTASDLLKDNVFLRHPTEIYVRLQVEQKPADHVLILSSRLSRASVAANSWNTVILCWASSCRRACFQTWVHWGRPTQKCSN